MSSNSFDTEAFQRQIFRGQLSTAFKTRNGYKLREYFSNDVYRRLLSFTLPTLFADNPTLIDFVDNEDRSLFELALLALEPWLVGELLKRNPNFLTATPRSLHILVNAAFQLENQARQQEFLAILRLLQLEVNQFKIALSATDPRTPLQHACDLYIKQYYDLVDTRSAEESIHDRPTPNKLYRIVMGFLLKQTQFSEQIVKLLSQLVQRCQNSPDDSYLIKRFIEEFKASFIVALQYAPLDDAAGLQLLQTAISIDKPSLNLTYTFLAIGIKLPVSLDELLQSCAIKFRDYFKGSLQELLPEEPVLPPAQPVSNFLFVPPSQPPEFVSSSSAISSRLQAPEAVPNISIFSLPQQLQSNAPTASCFVPIRLPAILPPADPSTQTSTLTSLQAQLAAQQAALETAQSARRERDDIRAKELAYQIELKRLANENQAFLEQIKHAKEFSKRDQQAQKRHNRQIDARLKRLEEEEALPPDYSPPSIPTASVSQRSPSPPSASAAAVSSSREEKIDPATEATFAKLKTEITKTMEEITKHSVSGAELVAQHQWRQRQQQQMRLQQMQEEKSSEAAGKKKSWFCCWK